MTWTANLRQWKKLKCLQCFFGAVSFETAKKTSHHHLPLSCLTLCPSFLYLDNNETHKPFYTKSASSAFRSLRATLRHRRRRLTSRSDIAHLRQTRAYETFSFHSALSIVPTPMTQRATAAAPCATEQMTEALAFSFVYFSVSLGNSRWTRKA